MTPFFFGSSERRLFGTFHPGSPSGAPFGVLFCNPFGQEAIRIHRLYSVLAKRLSQAGIAVLRFDQGGSGDSFGDDEDVTLEGWSQDVATAHAELVRRSSVSTVTWLGMRLGGTMALRAVHAGVNVKRMILWDPVIDGAKYWETLRSQHARELAPWPDVVAQGSHEALGFSVSPVLQQELMTLNADSVTLPSDVDIRVVSDDTHDAALAALVRKGVTAGKNIRLEVAAAKMDWVGEDPMNNALVPPRGLQQLMSLVTEA
jgi:pimeloyl-ACP methyl ester carboxylesterase